MASTVLDLLGIPGWEQHNLGASLLRRESPWFTHPYADKLRFVHALPNLRLSSGTEVVFDPAGPTVEVGGLRLLATGRGLNFIDAVFALAWRVERTPQTVDFRHFQGDQAYEELVAWAAGRSVLGVSTQPVFNRRFASESPGLPLFFAGSIGAIASATDAPPAMQPGWSALVAGWLRARQTVTLP